MRYSDAPEDFGDPFGEGPRAVATIVLDGHTLMLLLGFLIAGVVVFALTVWLSGQLSKAGQQARYRASARAIYDSVRYSLHLAVSASGALQLERARELSAVIEAKLGTLLALKDKTGKPFDDLKKALSEPEPDPENPKKDPPAKVKVDMTTDEHRVAVWRALQDFHEAWKDEAHILNLLEGAQAELGRNSVTSAFFHSRGLIDPRNPWGGAPAPKTPRPEKKKAKTRQPEELVVVTVTETTPLGPDDLPPPAPRPTKGKLAKHKRNMLA